MVLKIDGTDIVPYIAYGGVKWQRSDVDGEGAGRMLDGTLERNRMATKIRLDVTCRPLKSAEASIVLSAISRNGYLLHISTLKREARLRRPCTQTITRPRTLSSIPTGQSGGAESRSH